jgi:putative FmdB family regulatory protein
MPVYEYRCERCELKFDKIMPMPGQETQECPRCAGRAVRIISVVNHSFGWRLTERSLYGGVGSPKDEVEKDV